MYYLVYNQWDETGSSPTKVEHFEDKDAMSKRLTDIHNKHGNYEILLCVVGQKLIPQEVNQWVFTEEA